MASNPWTHAGEQSSMLRDDGVKTPSLLRQSNASNLPGAWYRFKKRCSLARISALPPDAAVEATSPGWKPLSTTALVLIPIAVSALAIAAAIEYLAQRSRMYGGLALAPTPDTVSQYAMMSYLYLPTVLAVVFSLVWSWVDLDVKRMQPWYELSKPEGALASDSLFLDYPYVFAGLVPFKALKRRHWPVFLSSLVVVITSWLITPLQSSILGTSDVGITSPVSLSARSRLAPVKEQQALLHPRILVAGYAVGWLGQPFPPWVTESYAILPFYVDNDPGQSRPGTYWTANTTKLTTELECWPAQVKQWPSPLDYRFNISSGRGCVTQYEVLMTLEYAPSKDNFDMRYIGNVEGPESEAWLNMFRGCPTTTDTIHQSVVIWSEQQNVSPGSNRTVASITALFCQSHYFKQDISVTVAADTLIPQDDSIVALAPKEPLTDREFNTTAFEFLITNGYTQSHPDLDIAFSGVVDQEQNQLANHGFNKFYPDFLVGYALAGQNESLLAYRDPGVLSRAFHHAHQYLFSLAVSDLLVNETKFPAHTANSSYVLSGIVVSRPISLAVEMLLVVAAICIFFLLWLSRLSPSLLHSNPSCLSRHVQVFQNSQDVKELFYNADCSDDKNLSRLFPHDRFQLAQGDSGPHKVAIERISEALPDVLEKSPDTQAGYYKPFRPLALRKASGLSFALIQIGALAVVQVLKLQEIRQQGLTRPSNDFEIRQLLENFIPTIFATLTEPVFLQLNRFLCVLQPFKALGSGRSIAAKSLDITYASFPSQLVLWRALGARHFLLSFMCAAALLSNVLAVGLSALFKEMPAAVSHDQAFRPKFAANFQDWVALGSVNPQRANFSSLTYTDHMYLAISNSSGTPLPPWTTAEYFFQPQTLVDPVPSSNKSTFVVATRGFGASANCTAMGAFALPPTYDQQWPLGESCPSAVDQVAWSFGLPNSIPLLNMTWISAQEGTAYDTLRCSRRLTFAWGRLQPGNALGKNPDRNRTMMASAVACNPFFQTAMFNVTHDVHGNIISYQRTSDLSTTLEFPGSRAYTDQILDWANSFLVATTHVNHNDTIARSWMNYFIVDRLESRDILDASKPVPDPEPLIPIIGDIYASLFSYLLTLNQQIFEASPSGKVTMGARFGLEDKIFMGSSAYVITTVLLILNIVAVGFFYSSAIVSTLPRMPTSIGSMLAYVAASRMAQKDGPQKGGEGNRTYSYGRYMGVDNEPHLGIDIDPFVALIDPKSLKGGKSLLSSWKKAEGKGEKVHEGPWI